VLPAGGAAGYLAGEASAEIFRYEFIGRRAWT